MQQLHIYTAYFDFTTAQIVINCTLKYALLHAVLQTSRSGPERRSDTCYLARASVPVLIAKSAGTLYT